MILVDSSAWIEFLRDTGSPICRRVDQLLRDDSPLSITSVIEMEILAGARDESHLGSLRQLLARATLIETTPTDFGDASMIFRTCRRRGLTVRRLTDCLIASSARRVDIPILHADSDFDAIASVGLVRLA